LLGNYNGTPTHTVSILEGIRSEFAGANITYVEGTQFLSHAGSPVPSSALSFDGHPGLRASYSVFDITDINSPGATKPLAQRIENKIDVNANAIPPEAASAHPLSIRWEGSLTAPETGDYNLGVLTAGFSRIQLDGKKVTSVYAGDPHEARMGRVHLEAGKPAALVVEYGVLADGQPLGAKLVWSKIDMRPQSEALEAAKASDVVVAVVGITSELEGEEMDVAEPGFKGGDRTSLDLPKPEEDLLKAVADSGKPLVVVLTNGSALAVNWAKDHANAILDAFYPGEEGGTAVAQTLSGRNNPAGRLPVTFYKDVTQLPPFEDYAMNGRTYRYFEGTPLYPFGYGLSYSTFSYSGLSLAASEIKAGDPAVAEVTVTNTGSREGDEVAELYLTFPSVAGAPLKALRAFERVHLEAGASRKVRVKLKARDMSMVTEAGEPIVAEGAYTVSVGGGQPGSGTQALTAKFNVKGSLALPE